MHIRNFRMGLSPLKLLPLILTSAFLNPADGQQTLTWDANTGTSAAQDGAGTWDTAANNWWDGSGNVLFANGDNVSFGAANANAAHTVTLGSSLSAGNVNFGGGNALPRYTVDLGGNTLTIGGQLNLYAQANAYYSAFANGTVSLARVGSSQGSPDIFFDPNDGADYGTFLTATVDVGTGSRYIRGAPQRNDFDRYQGDLRFDGPLTGSADVFFSGTTTDSSHNMHFGLNAANSGFTGAVTLGGLADLALLDNAALSASNNLTFNTTSGRATLFLYGHNVTIGNLSDTSSGGSRFIRNGSLDAANGGTNSADHGQQADSVISITQTTDGSFSGVVANGPNDNAAGASGTYRTLGLTKAGAATLTLNGVNTYTGPTTVSAGTLQIGGAGQLNSGSYAGAISLTGALNYASSASQTLSGNITGGGSLTLSGGGTLTLSGSSNAYTGGTTWSGGNLTIANGTALGTDAVAVTKTSAGTLTVANDSATAVANSISLPAPGSATTYTLIKNAASAATGTELNLTGNLTGGNANTTLFLNTNRSGDSTTTFRFAGSNSFRATLNLNRGAIVVGSATGLGDTANLIFLNSNPNGTDGNLRFESTMTLANPVQIAWDGMAINTGANTVTLSGVFSGTEDVNKIGTGTLSLTNSANTHSGAITISTGTFQVSGGGRLNNGTHAGAIINNGALAIGTTATQTLNGLISGAGTFSKSSSGILNLGNSGSSFSGGINITGGQVRATATSSGPTGALGTGPITIANGAALHFFVPSGSSSTFTNNIQLPTTGSQQFIISAPGSATTVRLTGQITGGSSGQTFRLTDSAVSGNHNNVLILDNPANSFTGTIEMWRGTLGFTSDAALGNLGNDIRHWTENNNGSLRFDADNIVLNSGRNIQFYGSNAPFPFNTQGYTGTVNGVISGTGNFVKQGSGTLVLNGVNTYNGSNSITAGTLRVTDVANAGVASGLGASSTQPLATVSPGATLEYAGAGADASNRGLVLTGSGDATVSVSNAGGILTLDGELSGTANLVKTGPGRLVVAGSESWNADGFVTGGTLTIGGVASPGGNSFAGGNWALSGGTFHINTTGTVSTPTLNASGGTVHLESGTLRVNTINASGGTVVWGGGTITPLTPSILGGDGVDVSGPGGSAVFAGILPVTDKQLYVDGNLATSAGTVLDLDDVYLSAGVIYNQLWVTGSLSIADGTTLTALASPFLLRPSTGGTPSDYGSMVLVHAVGGISYASPSALSFTAPQSDGRPFSQYTGVWPASGDASDLPINTWYLELGANEIILHYNVSAAIPEASTVSMLLGGALLLRVVRRRKT